MESKNFQTRKTVLEYDDVMNTQRKVIYEQRRRVLDGDNLKEAVQNMMHTVIANAVHGPHGRAEAYERRAVPRGCGPLPGVFLHPEELKLTDKELRATPPTSWWSWWPARPGISTAARSRSWASPSCVSWSGSLCSGVVDEYWMDEIDAMTELRQGIGLRGYGQHDPVVEYKREATRCLRT